MKWTKKSPTEPGWYWWRKGPGQNPSALKVAMRQHGLNEPDTLRVWYATRWERVAHIFGQWWPQPIPEPQETDA